MPIQPDIALGVKPLQLPDLGKAYSDSQDAALQRQLHGQQLQAAQRANRMADIQEQDRLKAITAYQKAGGRPKETLDEMRLLGVGPDIMQSTEKHFLDLDKQAAEIDEKKLPVKKYQNEQILALHNKADEIMAQGSEAFAQAWPGLVQRYAQIDPSNADHLDPSKVPTAQELGISRLAHQTLKDVYDRAAEQRAQRTAALAENKDIREQSAATTTALEGEQKLTEGQGKLEDRQAGLDAAMLAAAKRRGPGEFMAAMESLPPNRQARFNGIKSDSTEEDILSMATTPEQRIQSGIAAKNAENNVTESELQLRAAKGDLVAKAAIDAETARRVRIAQAGKNTDAAETKRVDQSYRYHNGQLVKIAQPLTDLAGRLTRLKDTIAQNSPQADALVAPELLTVMAGGQGSGLRMNEAEIARIIGGRSKWETLKAKINQWQTDPSKATSITPEQRTQIRALVSEVDKKLSNKTSALNDSLSKLAESDDPDEHKRILVSARKAITDVDTTESVDPKLKSYADDYFGGDIEKAKAHIAAQKK